MPNRFRVQGLGFRFGFRVSAGPRRGEPLTPTRPEGEFMGRRCGGLWALPGPLFQSVFS